MSAARSSAPAAAASARAPFKKRARGELDPADETDEQKQAAAHVSPVARLYRHALESVFGFLALADLSRVLSVSRSWSAAERSMRSIHATVVRPQGRFGMIAASALAHHISQIGAPADALHNAVRPVLSSSDLFILSRHLASLTSLCCVVEQSHPSRLFFGPSLQTVDIGLGGMHPGAINEAIGTISRLPTLTDLRLELPAFFPALNFALLAAASALRDLTLRSAGPVEPAHSQLDQLRTLMHLRKMSVVGLSLDDLAYLLRTPHSLQWQVIHQVEGIDDAAATALSNLPSLTTLDPYVCRSVAFLPSLTRLRTLALHMDGTARLAADIAVGLSCCADLTELTLAADDVTSKHLSQALSHLPLLCKLTVQDCSALDSLSFLSECAHLAHSLHTFDLRRCRKLSSIEMEHVLTLKNLTSLVLYRSFMQPLDASTLDSLKPPSSVLPALTQFVHSNY